GVGQREVGVPGHVNGLGGDPAELVRHGVGHRVRLGVPGVREAGHVGIDGHDRVIRGVLAVPAIEDVLAVVRRVPARRVQVRRGGGAEAEVVLDQGEGAAGGGGVVLGGDDVEVVQRVEGQNGVLVRGEVGLRLGRGGEAVGVEQVVDDQGGGGPA